MLEENLKCLSLRQKKWERQAQEIYKAMGTPTVDDLKEMIWMNITKNNMVTMDDINLATKAYGPDVGEVKGKLQKVGRHQLLVT